MVEDSGSLLLSSSGAWHCYIVGITAMRALVPTTPVYPSRYVLFLLGCFSASSDLGVLLTPLGQLCRQHLLPRWPAPRSSAKNRVQVSHHAVNNWLLQKDIMGIRRSFTVKTHGKHMQCLWIGKMFINYLFGSWRNTKFHLSPLCIRSCKVSECWPKQKQSPYSLVTSITAGQNNALFFSQFHDSEPHEYIFFATKLP